MRILPDGTVEYREASWYVSEDRELRKKYFEIGYERYLDVENSLAEALISEVKKNIFFATARKYESSAEAALAGNSIPVEVLDNVVDTIGNNLTALNKYYDLRRRALGLEDLHIYDFGPTIIPGYDAEMSYEDAKGVILNGLKPLGEEYAEVLQTAFDNRWIDVYPGENKYRGAYNISAYSLNPYILMNYTDSFYDMKTLAHELGHAVHGYWSNSNQSYRNSSKPPFVSEVASITNELLIMRQAIDNAKDNQEKMALIDMMISDMDGTVFFQIMLQEYEKTLHEMQEAGQGLSTKVLKQLWADLCVKYWGPTFVPDEFYNVRGLNISHYYRGFYVYSYATSFIAAYPISEAVYNGEEGAVEGYLDFLRAGGSDYPVEIIKTMGVDLTKTEPIEAFLAEFTRLVDELETLMIEEGLITAEN
jgi:oligoendopeptidase F